MYIICASNVNQTEVNSMALVKNLTGEKIKYDRPTHILIKSAKDWTES
jgi:hypothetical protein